ncbi:Glyoxylate/hydroxypyruvate reductase A [Vibrio mediterranei]|uniref:D-2-hydroxyacid dehydrogenase n=1 Tax=Vibrio mediterranei TaxID=689 RepID=UPI0007823256|nr:D-2-hydroxyacid dehydrogenase [Vibrio mediterranei]MCG9666141.1 D-2-hydroxyacid dehydrogenase [Vibrio mediterranei]PTC02938.1 D-2-hydroxyacid dehydrogenase [Vibrio mediterranei]SBO12146.1 Glyoxylate/hydroxypyruvate reductase A [Vibrio mediterranei]
MTTQKHRLALVTDNNEHYLPLLEAKQLPDLEIISELSNATIVLAAPPKLASELDSAEQLQWVQSTYAGIDALLGESLRKDYKLTNVKGIFGQQISEYVLGYTINYFRHFDLYKQQQQKRDWQPHSYQSLIGKRMVIFGTGAIGSHLANTVKVLGIVPIGVNRTGIPPRQSAFAETFHINEAEKALEHADIIVNTLPNTPTTDGLFNEPLFAACRHALFFNVGRGQTVDSNALLSALDKGHLVHAFLDVFINEPISQECPYWHNPNVTVTPHIAAISFPEQVVEIFAENYLRWRDGFQLQNLVDFERGY